MIDTKLLDEVYANVHEFDVEDPTVLSVMRKFESRSAAGMKAYGTTMAANKEDKLFWIESSQEELMDAILYLERLRQELINEQ